MNYKEELKEILPFLGHRNWIVVTDMAYPLQTAQGIKTLYTNESYMDVLSFAFNEIEKALRNKMSIFKQYDYCI
ncbi:hypothetical protein AGMMS4957_15230 [Bacteroidia bacterium]|nr:hypothetical protein AGMMS4957_15230 [Bacteroidia bacterium]